MLTSLLLAVTLTYVDPGHAVHAGEYSSGGINDYNAVNWLVYQGRAEMRGVSPFDYVWRCLDETTACMLAPKQGR